MLNDRLNHRSALLDTLRPLITRPADHARRRRDQHERVNKVRVRRRKQHRQGAALGKRNQRRPFRARGLEHRTNIIDLLLQRRGPCDPAGHARATSIELDQPRKRREPREKARRGRQFPVELNVREPPRDDQHIERPLTAHLIGDLQITTTRIPRDNLHRARIVCPERPAGPAATTRNGRGRGRQTSLARHAPLAARSGPGSAKRGGCRTNHSRRRLSANDPISEAVETILDAFESQRLIRCSATSRHAGRGRRI